MMAHSSDCLKKMDKGEKPCSCLPVITGVEFANKYPNRLVEALLAACHEHLRGVEDAEENIEEATGEEWEDITKLRAAMKALEKIRYKECLGKGHNPTPGRTVRGSGICVECGGRAGA